MSGALDRVSLVEPGNGWSHGPRAALRMRLTRDASRRRESSERRLVEQQESARQLSGQLENAWVQLNRDYQRDLSVR